MSTRSEITRELSASLERFLNPHKDTRIYIAKEVTFDYASDHAIRVDYMQFKPVNNTVSGIEKGDIYCYEIKSSVADFHSGHGLNFIGDYNYLVMPEEVYAAVANEIPRYVGVIVPTESSYRNNWQCLKSIKNAKRRDREKPLTEMLFMMFRSAARDRCKLSQTMLAREEKDAATGMVVAKEGDE
jgi:hypothetical protein